MPWMELAGLTAMGAVLLLTGVLALGETPWDVWKNLCGKLRYGLDWENNMTYCLALSVVLTLLAAFLASDGAFSERVFCALQCLFEVLEGNSDTFRGLAPSWAEPGFGFLSVMVPVSTAGTLFAFLSRHLPGPMPMGQVYHIFAQLDERSVLLANSLEATGQEHQVFIFLRCGRKETSSELLSQLMGLRFRLYPRTEEELLRRHCLLRYKKLRFYFISKDSDCNFDRMSGFVENVRAKELFRQPHNPKRREAYAEYRQELYLLSETDTSAMLIDDMRSRMCNERGRLPVFAGTELRLLDRYRAVCYDLLRVRPLRQEGDRGHSRVLILGFGKVGQAFLRTAAAFSCIGGRKTTFTICDQVIEKRFDGFRFQFPEACTDLSYVLQELNMESPRLVSLLNESAPFTYILLSLGDDELNIRVASMLMRHYRKMRWQKRITRIPQICVNVEDSVKSENTSALYNQDVFLGDKLYVFGTDQRTFSTELLMPRGIWIAAQRLHGYLNQEEVWKLKMWSEYERRSSVAAVCRAVELARITEMKRLEGIQLSRCARAEHQCWMNYVRSEGMQKVTMQEVEEYYPMLGRHVDITGQLTPCLIETGKLDLLHKRIVRLAKKIKESKSVQIRVPKRSFRDRDRLVAGNCAALYQMIENQDPNIALEDFVLSGSKS